MWKLTPEDNSFFSMMVHSSTFACQATQCFLSLVQGELAVEEAMRVPPMWFPRQLWVQEVPGA